MVAADLKRIVSQVLQSPTLKAQARLLGVENHLEMIEGNLWKINSMYMHGLMTAVTKPDVKQWTDDVEETVSDLDQLLGRILRFQPKEAPAKSPPSVRGDLLLGMRETASKLSRRLAFGAASSLGLRSEMMDSKDPEVSPSVRGDLLLGLRKTASKLNRLAFGGAFSLGLRAETMDSKDARREDFYTVLKDEVEGLESATNEIIKELQRQQQYEEIPSIFCLAGHEGMGKTTLARMVYHDEWVRNYFQHHVWVDSPDSFSFDPISVAHGFAEALTKQRCGRWKYLQQLWLDVSKKISVGRYFLVIDNVPVLTKDSDKWEQLRHVFLRLGTPGSRVLAVTSVHHSDLVGRNPTFANLLPPVESLSRRPWTNLLRRRASALAGDDEDKQIRRSIVDEFAVKLHKKSRGSPSLAKVWGSALQSTEVHRLRGQIEALWREPLQEEQHFGSWSSQYLVPKDAHLYLFSSLFQQDHEHDDYEDLFHLMDARGFIQDPSNKALMISNLKRSLLHFATRDSHRKESLTDDLICSLPILEATRPSSENEKKVLTYWNTEGFPKSTHHQLQCQHLSVLIKPSTDLKLQVTLPSKLITLKLIMDDVAETEEQKKTMEGQIVQIGKLLGDNFSNLRYLRVLDLRATQIAKMPETVGELVSLRYLNLSWSNIDELPDSLCDIGSLQTLKLSHCYKLLELPHCIGKLQNLQVLKLPFCKNLTKLPESLSNLIDLQELDLECCRRLEEFPDEFGNLKSLRSLSLVGCLSLTKMPSGMRRLSELRKLSGFVALQECGSCTVTELGPLRHLEDLQLRGLEGVSSTNDAEALKLKNKRFARNLVLHWNRDDRVSSDSLLEILECLQPGTALRTLEINSYSGEEFPNWMKAGWQPYHYTLREIKLVNLRNCTSLPPLGLLARLEVVEISGMVELRKVDDEFYGENGTFASLSKLTFSEMPELQQWSEVQRKSQLFPKLTELTIIQCPKLKQLEVELTAVKKLSLWLSSGTLLTSKSWDWSKFSGLRELEIVGCPGLKHLPGSLKGLEQMKHLTLIGLDTLESLPNWFEKKEGFCLEFSRCGKVPEPVCQNASKRFSSSATSNESGESDQN